MIIQYRIPKKSGVFPRAEFIDKEQEKQWKKLTGKITLQPHRMKAANKLFGAVFEKVK